MKRKGFTLIELMAVIIVLGIIAAIAFPMVNNLLKSSKEDLYKTQVKSIEDAVKKMAINNTDLLVDSGSSCVSLDSILKSGHLDKKEVIDPRNDEKMNGSVKITYDKEYNQYNYAYQEKNCTGTITGTARLYDQTVIAGANVSMIQNGTTIKTTQTATDGTFTLSDLPYGTFTLRVMTTAGRLLYEVSTFNLNADPLNLIILQGDYDGNQKIEEADVTGLNNGSCYNSAPTTGSFCQQYDFDNSNTVNVDDVNLLWMTIS